MSFKNGVPKRSELYQGVAYRYNQQFPVEHRHLAATGFQNSVMLKIQVETMEAEGGGDEELKAMFENPDFGRYGKVMCPVCEDDDEPDCDFCAGTGMVTRKKWDTWYKNREEEEKCDENCTSCERELCTKDMDQTEFEVETLHLFIADGSKWKDIGNSEDGFNLHEAPVKNADALARHIVATIEWNGIESMEEGEED